MSGTVLMMTLLGTAGVLFAVIRSRSSAPPRSGASSANEHQRLPENALRVLFAELSLDEEITLLCRLSPEMAEWMNLLAEDEVDEAMRRAEAVHAATPGSRAATCFLMRARFAMGDNQGAAQVAQAYFSAVGISEIESLLQTWHHLRAMNVFPDKETARQVVGVIVELNDFEKGGPAIPITLSAHLDGSSVLHRGRRRVPAGPDSRRPVHEATMRLVAAASDVDRPPPTARSTKPVEGLLMRFTLLSPGGPSVVELDIAQVKGNEDHPLFQLLLLTMDLVMKKQADLAA
ncbi:hypothetical protein LY474_24825 [Myxococcus stipitatus]|uniref:hypothetical protein n=1 Tax=Myxococcus stipitatus TaxID=83455 RepID=UPI001F43B1AF|nr:hypothetical protein [Myxococcus stipitatus]MCE9671039.1 hypothetical protein [Myxococcus stipitatus]